jgi:two-component system response regulator PilR (NtrC family)
VIGLGDLPREISGASAQATPALSELPAEGCNLDEVLGEMERRILLQALERSGGVRTNAAKLLGVTLRSLRYRLQKHALDVGDPERSSGKLEAAEETAVDGDERETSEERSVR